MFTTSSQQLCFPLFMFSLKDTKLLICIFQKWHWWQVLLPGSPSPAHITAAPHCPAERDAMGSRSSHCLWAVSKFGLKGRVCHDASHLKLSCFRHNMWDFFLSLLLYYWRCSWKLIAKPSDNTSLVTWIISFRVNYKWDKWGTKNHTVMCWMGLKSRVPTTCKASADLAVQSSDASLISMD